MGPRASSKGARYRTRSGYFLKARLRAALPRFYRSLRRLRSLPLHIESGPGGREESPQRTETMPEAPKRPTEWPAPASS